MTILPSIVKWRPKLLAIVCALLFVSLAQIGYGQIYTVKNTFDAGVGSLRDAITQVNAGTYDEIDFAIPNTDPGYDASNNTWTIQPVSDLPSIIKTVTIDGYSQPGSSPNTLSQGNNAVLTIVLNGNLDVSDGYTVGNGLHFLAGSDSSIVEGLVINGWALNGILIDGASGTINGISVIGNFIGTDSTGTIPVPTRTGVGISGAVNPVTNTQVGTVNLADRNLFGGSFGYMIFDSYVVRGACICSCYNNGTTIVNNYIGTDRTGSSALGLSQCGVMFIVENDSTIGGSTAAELNLISGQSLYGINLTSILPTVPAPLDESGGCTDCLVQGNYVGTDITGSQPLGNNNTGIAIDSYSTNNLVVDNLVSANGTGVRLGQNDLPGGSYNIMQGNYVGTNGDGTVALGNRHFGVIVNDNYNTVGGSSPGDGNLISGNGGGGVLIYGASGVTVSGNYIGTDVTGQFLIPNSGKAIQLGANGPSSCNATNFIIENNVIGEKR